MRVLDSNSQYSQSQGSVKIKRVDSFKTGSYLASYPNEDRVVRVIDDQDEEGKQNNDEDERYSYQSEVRRIPDLDS